MRDGDSRTAWVDYAKAIGIILVVYGHVARGLVKSGILPNSSYFHAVDDFIYSFHMPLFFFLSGLFFLHSMNRRGAGGVILSKIDTIVYPYILWSILQGSIEVILSRYTNGNASWSDLLEILTVPRAQFWFLYALFLVFCVAVLVYRNAKKTLAGALLFVSATAYLTQNYYPEQLHIAYVTNNFVFFAAGASASLVEQLPWRRIATPAFGAIGGFISIWVLIYLYRIPTTPDSSAISLILAFSGISAVVAISVLIAKFVPSSALTLVGAMSMQIYLMHIIAGSGLRVFLSKGLGVQDAWIHLALGTIIGVCLPMTATLALNRLGIKALFEPPHWLSFSLRKNKGN